MLFFLFKFFFKLSGLVLASEWTTSPESVRVWSIYDARRYRFVDLAFTTKRGILQRKTYTEYTHLDFICQRENTCGYLNGSRVRTKHVFFLYHFYIDFFVNCYLSQITWVCIMYEYMHNFASRLRRGAIYLTSDHGLRCLTS